MRLLIVGGGSIGERHLGNLKKIGKEDLLLFDIDKKKARAIAKKYKIKPVSSLEEGLSLEPLAVFICTPTSHHIKLALKAANEDCHLFIEKPISHNLEGINKLENLSKKNKLVIQIGCNLRFHPLLIKTKRLLEEEKLGEIYSVKIEYGFYLPSWRPTQDYIKNYAAKKSMGGGIILDDIHEIDYAVWLFGKIEKLFCAANKISDLKIETEDNAEIILKTKKSFVINIHMDYLQQKPTRKFKIICQKGNIKGDINKNYLRFFKNKRVYESKKKYDFNKTYIEEIKDFIRCIKEKKKPKVGFKEAVYDLKIALAAKKSAKKGQEVEI